MSGRRMVTPCGKGFQGPRVPGSQSDSHLVEPLNSLTLDPSDPGTLEPIPMSDPKFSGTDYYAIDELLESEEKLARETARAFVTNEFLPVVREHFRHRASLGCHRCPASPQAARHRHHRPPDTVPDTAGGPGHPGPSTAP